MQFAEPHGVESKLVAELDLGQDVAIALRFGKAAGAGQLVENPEAHSHFPAIGYRPLADTLA